MEKQFLQAVHDYQKIIHKVCRVYRDNKEDQEDLYQEIVYQLWKSFPSFKNEAKVSSWMYRIALNTAMTIYRKKAPAVEYVDTVPEQQQELPEKPVSDNEERLFSALRKLNDTEKAVISLFLEDFNYQEIAAITGLTENNIGVRLNRIRQKLKDLLN